MSRLGPLSSVDGTFGEDGTALEQRHSHCAESLSDRLPPAAEEMLRRETHQMIAVLTRLQQDYAICLKAEVECYESLAIFADNLAYLKAAIQQGSWSDATALVAGIKEDVSTLRKYIDAAEAQVNKVAQPALQNIKNEKWWLDVKLAILESQVTEGILVGLTRLGIWGTSAAAVGFLAHGVSALIAASFPGTVTIPAGSTIMAPVGPTTFVPEVMTTSFTYAAAEPIYAAVFGPAFWGLAAFLGLLVKLDEASVAAVREWFRRHRSSARAALDRAEEHFEKFIERARALADQKENLDNVSKLLDAIQANCKNAEVLSEKGAGSVLMQSRLLKHKCRVEDLLTEIEEHLQALHRLTLTRPVPAQLPGTNELPHLEQVSDKLRSSGIATSSFATSSSATAAHPERRSHRQRLRLKKWRGSVQIPTPEVSDCD